MVLKKNLISIILSGLALLSLMVFCSKPASAMEQDMPELKRVVYGEMAPQTENIYAVRNRPDAYDHPVLLRAIEKLKQFAKDFREGIFDYVRECCDTLDKKYGVSCSFGTVF